METEAQISNSISNLHRETYPETAKIVVFYSNTRQTGKGTNPGH